MGQTLIKPDRDEDFYVLWSSIVEAPLAWGTRAGIIAYGLGDDAEERIARTDKNGTSALWPSTGSYAYAYNDDDGIVYQQQGIVRRHNLKELCNRLAQSEDPDLSDLIEPFED
jgi:hypothetical protein